MSTNHNCFEEKGEPKWIRTDVPLLTSITPYRWAKPAHGNGGAHGLETWAVVNRSDCHWLPDSPLFRCPLPPSHFLPPVDWATASRKQSQHFSSNNNNISGHFYSVARQVRCWKALSGCAVATLSHSGGELSVFDSSLTGNDTPLGPLEETKLSRHTAGTKKTLKSWSSCYDTRLVHCTGMGKDFNHNASSIESRCYRTGK